MDEKHYPAETDHELHITNRENVLIKGVLHVNSFDDQEVVLDTDCGTLTIRGEDLHIKQLDLQDGSFSVEGIVHSLQYSSGRGKGLKGRGGKGLLDRLLR